jgi:CRP-like cAMP-binding protein
MIVVNPDRYVDNVAARRAAMTVIMAPSPFAVSGCRCNYSRRMQQRQRVAQLSKIPLFANCSKRELARLLSGVRTESVEAGQTLFVEGAPSANLYLIVTGSAVVRKNGRRVARLGPGEVVGELSVILGTPRTATVVSETPIEWLVLDQASLRKAIDEVPGLGWNVLRSVASRLEQANNGPM